MKKEERLKKAIEFLKSQGKVHKQKDVASMMGASEATISNALKGDEAKLTDKFLKRFNAAYGNIFNIDWLLEGEGEMLNEQTDKAISVNINHSTSDEENDSNYMYVETRPRLPIAAALGNISDYYKGNKKNECDPKPIVKQFSKYNFTMLVNTDCMSPYINTGDVIACAEIGDTIDYGHVYVVDTDGGALIKRVYQVQGNDSVLDLVSENPTYPDFLLDKEKVIGMYRVVGLLRVGI